jgi:hypothetical protein
MTTESNIFSPLFSDGTGSSEPLTREEVIDLIGFEPAVSTSQSIITDLAMDVRPGEALSLDANNKVFDRGEVVGRQTYYNNSTNKTALAAYFATTVLYLPVWGQSLAKYGGTYTPALLNPTQSRTGKVLIPSVGMFTNGQPWDTTKDGVDEYYDASDVNQGSSPTGAAFAYLVSFGNRLYDRIYTDFGVAPTILLTCDALEGQSIDDLAPGSSAAERALRNMSYAKSWAYANSLQIDMPLVRWIHGNADFLTKSGLRYEARCIELQQFATKARREQFGQAGDVRFYIQQCASARPSVGDVSQVTMAQLNLTRRLPDKFRFLTPDTDLVHSDGTHMDSYNYNIRDLKHADNVFDDFFGGGIAPFAVTREWWVGSMVARFEIEVPVPPLVIDYTDTSATVTADAGTDVITGATLINGTVVFFGNSGGALPDPLVAGTRYYVVNTSGSTFKVAATSGGAAIDLTTAGTGTNTVYVNGIGVTFDDDSGSAPYPTTMTIIDDGTYTSGNDPLGRAVVEVTLSGAPATYGRKRFMFGMLQGPSSSPGQMAGARNVLRDTAATTSSVNRAGSASSYTLRNWMAMQEVYV